MGQNAPKHDFCSPLKPNLRNIQIAIFRKVRTRSMRNSKSNFRSTNRFCGWSDVTK